MNSGLNINAPMEHRASGPDSTKSRAQKRKASTSKKLPPASKPRKVLYGRQESLWTKPSPEPDREANLKAQAAAVEPDEGFIFHPDTMTCGDHASVSMFEKLDETIRRITALENSNRDQAHKITRLQDEAKHERAARDADKQVDRARISQLEEQDQIFTPTQKRVARREFEYLAKAIAPRYDQDAITDGGAAAHDFRLRACVVILGEDDNFLADHGDHFNLMFGCRHSVAQKLKMIASWVELVEDRSRIRKSWIEMPYQRDRWHRGEKSGDRGFINDVDRFTFDLLSVDETRRAHVVAPGGGYHQRLRSLQRDARKQLRK